MRFAVFSAERCSLSWQSRLQDEGHELLVYMDRKYKVGEGIVPLERNVGRWEDWAAEKPSETVVLFDTSRNGERADRLRRAGAHVIGGGGICDKLEGDRYGALLVAERLGLKTPKSEKFSYLSESIAFLKKKRSESKWFFKPNRDLGCSFTLGESPERLIPFLEYVKESKGDRIAHLLQAEIEGTAISTGAWWNGTTFLAPYEGTIEHKKFMNGDIGPSLGCAFNVLWFYDDDIPEIARKLCFEELAEWLRKEQAPAGIYDINAVVAKEDGEPYFLEFTPRMGYDSEPTAQRLVDGLGSFLYGLASGTLREAPFTRDEAALSIRVSVPPVPSEDEDAKWEGDPHLLGVDSLWESNFIAYNVCRTDGVYRVCDPMGIVGLSLATGTDLTAMNDEALDFLDDDLWVNNPMYRTDAASVLGSDIEAVRAAGYSTAAMLEV